MLGGPASVAVSASATEVHPDSFTVAIRIRPLGGARDAPVDLVSVIRLENAVTGGTHPVTGDIRDELISLEHSATHFN